MVDYRHRSMSAHVSIAELYHENSKLFQERLPELSVALVRADAIRKEFLERRAVVVNASGTAPLELDQNYRELLLGVTRTTPADLFYAVELRVVAGDLVAVHEPLSNVLQVVKRLSTDEIGMVTRAIRLMQSPDAERLSGPLLILVGSFARNDILFGARGYRRTLLEAGRIAQEIFCNAERLSVETRAVYEFIDRELDRVMEADGIEQSTLMVFELGGVTDAV